MYDKSIAQDMADGSGSTLFCTCQEKNSFVFCGYKQPRIRSELAYDKQSYICVAV